MNILRTTGRIALASLLLYSPAGWAAVPAQTPVPADDTGLSLPQEALRADAAEQLIDRKNLELAAAAAPVDKHPADTITNTENWQISYLPSGQIAQRVSFGPTGTGPRITIAYTYFANGDVSAKTRSETIVVHGTLITNAAATLYGYDAKGRHAAVQETTTDPGGVTTVTAVYSYAYDGERRNFQKTSPVPGGEVTQGYDLFDNKGRIVQHVENTSVGGVFNPLSSTATTYKYRGSKVTETIDVSRVVNGESLTAEQVLERKLPPNYVNQYNLVGSVPLLQESSFYFYDVNGTHRIVTNLVYQRV